jgi:hypothetical protein
VKSNKRIIRSHIKMPINKITISQNLPSITDWFSMSFITSDVSGVKTFQKTTSLRLFELYDYASACGTLGHLLVSLDLPSQ